MIRRLLELNTLRRLLRDCPVVGLVGARQVGKTTLARSLLRRQKAGSYFDLENPADDARLTDPVLALKDVRGLVVLDEIQRRPDLFAVADHSPGLAAVKWQCQANFRD